MWSSSLQGQVYNVNKLKWACPAHRGAEMIERLVAKPECLCLGLLHLIFKRRQNLVFI